jgi:hypothetical protein
LFKRAKIGASPKGECLKEAERLIMKYKESAKEYLSRSSLGEKFEYNDIDHLDDGLFGGEMYEGMGRLGEYGERGYRNEEDEEVLDLYFEEKEERLHISVSYHFANMLIIATPRDPRGENTVSVYQDFSLVGWIIGKDQATLAAHLVDHYKNCSAVFPLEGIDLTNTERRITMVIPKTKPSGAIRLNWDSISES